MINPELVLTELRTIKDILSDLKVSKSDILNLSQATEYLRISKPLLHKLLAERTIPCYRPTPRLIYFKRVDLDNFLLSNKQESMEEINNNLFPYKQKTKS